MAKITIYGYRPNKLPTDYREIFFMDSMNGEAAATAVGESSDDESKFICNITNLFFTSNKSNKQLRLGSLYVYLVVCLMVFVVTV